MTAQLCALVATPVLAAPESAGPPKTDIRPVKEVLHGVELVDNYRWLEGDNSDPKTMGKANAEVGAWTDAQNAHTRAILDNLPGRKELEARLRPLMEIGSVSAPSMRGNRYFYTKREGKQNQPIVYMREGHDGQPRALLDPGAIDPSGLTALGGFTPSKDGTLAAFSLYRAGDENTTIYFMNIATGEWLPDELEGKASVVQWLPDNSGIFYERLADVKDPYSARIMFHRLGQHPRHDTMLFRQYTKEENEKLATTWGPGATISEDGRWMVLYYWTSTSSNDIWVIDLAKWWKDGKVGGQIAGTFEKTPIKVGEPNKFFGQIGTKENGDPDTFYMLTDYGAAKNRLVAIDLKNPAEANWREVIPENKDAVLTGVGMAKGVLTADYEENAQSRIRLFSRTGASLGDLKLPGIGTAGVSVETDRTEAFVTFTSYNYPSTIFRTDLLKADKEPAVWERPAVPVDPSIAEVKQVFYQSKDGTKVPMFIVHKKGLKLDGTNPTILYGYGGFNISMTPGFSATLFPWLEDGGVYAVANIRGGGEFGKPWHEAAMLGNKQNCFDDFIAAGEYLIANKYTNANRLGAIGGSNGGLLMGAMITQRPDLFRAVVCAVPLLDMVRFQNFLMARYWVPEYGTAENSDHFQWLLKYSPYQNIKQGAKYPATLFTAGENDSRTHPMHARKMAAAVQAATASDPADKPVLLWVDRDAGHGQGKPLNLRIRDAADTRIFFMWQLGMMDKPGEDVSK